ncbi:hypothetical protein GINT2_000054 [Glugoides intestinalis]
MDKDSALRYLHNTLQSDGNIRTRAESAIRQAIQDNFQDSLAIFIQIILDPMVPQPSRQICSIIVKNCLHSKNKRIQKSYESSWLACSPEFRYGFLEMLNKNLNIKETSILTNITKIYGSIIRIEVDSAGQTAVFETLKNTINNPEFASGVLKTLAYACDQLYEETSYIFAAEKNVIFEIGTFYLDSLHRQPKDIVLSTLKCILSCLEVYNEILNTDSIRQNLISKIIECDKSDYEILEASLDVLTIFVDIYAVLSDAELSVICQYFISLFVGDFTDLPLQLFDLWDLLIDLEKFTVIKQFIPTLVPNLMLCIKKESPDDTSTSSHKSACALLEKIVSKTQVFLLSEQVYQNFILNNLKSQEIESHAIAATALGCICTLGADEFLYHVLPVLITDLSYEECVNEALFAISKICEKDISITVNFLLEIIQKTEALIEQRSQTAVNSLLFYNTVFNSIKLNSVIEAESILSFHYPDILSTMIRRLDQSQSNEYDVRIALNIVLLEMIVHCPLSQKKILDNLEGYLISKIKATIEIIKNSNEQTYLTLDDMLCSYIILIEPCLNMKKVIDISEISHVFTACLLLPKMLAHGEIYIAISKLLSHFSMHLKKFMPFVLRDLSCDEIFVLKSALNLLSDCALLLESNFMEFAGTAVPALANAITSTLVPLNIKPLVISSLGDIALAIGRKFEPYISLCLLLFSQINTLNREGDEEYVDNLRRAMLKIFSCLVLSIGNSAEMNSSFRQIIENVRIAIQSDKEFTYVKESIDALSDIQSIFGTVSINHEWILTFLHEVLRSFTGYEHKIAEQLLEYIY